MCMIFVLYLIANVMAAEVNREVMKAFSYTFGLKMFECGEKLNYSKEMAEDILHFWDQNHDLDNIGVGCLIICAMVKLQLLDSKGNLVRPHAEGYIRANGADDDMVRYLIERFNKCREETEAYTTNPCEAALETSKCFRLGIFEKNWTPDTSSLMKIPYRRACPNK